MPVILQYLGQFGMLVLATLGKTLKFIPKAITYIPKSPRGKFIYGGATVGSIALFNDDQYEALEHVFIHPGSEYSYSQVVREFMFSDVSFAKSAQNYLTGDYGKTLMIHIGLTGITLLPIGLMSASGIRNAKAVTSSASLLAQYGTKIKNFRFSDFAPLFYGSVKGAKGVKPIKGYGSMYQSIPVSKRQKFVNDFMAYFNRVTPKGKAANAKGSNSVSSRLSGLSSQPTTITKIKDVALRKDVLAIETIVTLFVTYWLATNDDTVDIIHSKAEVDMSSLDNMITDTYNFYHANTMLGGDINRIKTTMKVDVATAKHIFITYIHLGNKLINTWLALNEMNRLRFHRLISVQFKGIHDILTGNTTVTRINASMLTAVLDAISHNSLPDLVSALALQREIDPITKKAVYSGSDTTTTFKKLFHFIGDNDIIKELYADGAAAPIVNSTPSNSDHTELHKEAEKAAKAKAKTTTKSEVKKEPTAVKTAFNKTPKNEDTTKKGKEEYVPHHQISDDMLNNFNDLFTGNSNVS